MQEERRKSFRRKVADMEVGDVVKVAVTNSSAQRSAVSVVGLDLSRKYSCHVDRESMILEITRES